MPLISCENVSLSYDSKTIIKNLSFSVNQGDYLTILGENGSGKSTLIKAILGLKSVTKGKIIFNEELKQREIGYIPQQTQVQKDFPATVWEVVRSGLLNKMGFRMFYSKSQNEKALEIMRKLNIEEMKNESYRALSGGQQQRVLLARALCATTKVLLLDEPVGGLDHMMTIQLYNLIEKINKEENITIIMVSHDYDAAMKYSSHILHIHKNYTFFGTKEDYLKCPVCNAEEKSIPHIVPVAIKHIEKHKDECVRKQEK